MSNKKIKVLLIIEQCNPEMASVPLEGWKYFQRLNQLVDAHLVTHERNQKPLAKVVDQSNITYIYESNLTKKYYQFLANVSLRGRANWPLANILGYPIYEEFNQQVYQKFKTNILRGDYDIVHALTPMMPRFPVKAVKACQKTPFILGPVNGGIPFPPGFEQIAKQEFAYLNFFRAIGRVLIPGYIATYKQADQVLAGSTYTLNMLKENFQLTDDKIQLFYENGIDPSFINRTPKNSDPQRKIELLFVGRLVPYKCADIVIEALSLLDEKIKDKIHFTIVGDGSEKANLEAQSQQLNLEKIVSLVGWVEQSKTLEYYRQSDIFCFPSIREFGGAVVLEAMANGLTCIVANNGGIGEYVTEDTGFKIDPISREYLVKEVADKIKILVENDQLRQQMAINSIASVEKFIWENKAQQIVDIYHQILAK